MKYRFVQEHQDYSDLAAGRVFQSLPGNAPFPVRLASEIFQRCVTIRRAHGEESPCVLYDPFCGSGYLLAVLVYLHRASLSAVIGSDINPEALQLSERNLAILTPDGITARVAQIQAMLTSFGKTSHAEALTSAELMKRQLVDQQAHPVATRLFLADATNEVMISKGLGALKVDLVITDIPYGQNTSWVLPGSAPVATANPIAQVLTALRNHLPDKAVVAITANKSQRFAHEAYRQVSTLQIGKRRVVFVMPAHSSE